MLGEALSFYFFFWVEGILRQLKQQRSDPQTLDRCRKPRFAKRKKKENSKNISLKFLSLAFRKILARFFATLIFFCLHLQSFFFTFLLLSREDENLFRHTCFHLLIDGSRMREKENRLKSGEMLRKDFVSRGRR